MQADGPGVVPAEAQGRARSGHVRQPSLIRGSPWALPAFLVLALSVVCAVELAQVLFYNFVTYKVFFHSDAASKNFLAEEIIRTRQLFPASWYSADNVWVLANHLYVLVMYPLVGINAFRLHAAAGLLNVAALCVCAWGFLTVLQFRPVIRLLTVTILLSGLSGAMATHIFGEAAYGFILTLTFLNLWLFYLAVRAGSSGGKRFVICSLVFGVVCMLTVAGGIRWILGLFIPLLLANFLQFFFFQSERDDARAMGRLTLVLVVAAALGMGIYSLLNSTHTVVVYKASSGFADSDRIATNVRWLALGFLNLFGAVPPAEAEIVSLDSLKSAYGFMLAGFTLAGAVALLAKLRCGPNRNVVHFALFALAAVVINLYVLTFTNIVVNLASARYLVVSVAMLLILALKYVDVIWPESGRWPRWTWGLLALLVPIYLLSPLHMVVPALQANTTGDGLQLSLKTGQSERLAQFLTARKLSHCYATYWYAGAPTVLSGSQVKVRQVTFQDQLPVPFHWLASTRGFARRLIPAARA